jgi:intracellular multiplication protein IcmC
MMMPALASVSGPLAKMAIGALLIYLPGTLDTVIYTFWGYGSSSVLLSWDSTPNHPGSSTSTNIPLAILNAAAALIRLFGYIALINGFVVLSRVTKQGAPPGQWGKGIMHIIGGVLAINIIETVNVIWSTLFG